MLAIIGRPGQSWTSQRDHLLLTMLYNTGARVSEMTGVRVADVVLDGAACVHLHGKGRKQRTVPLWRIDGQGDPRVVAAQPRAWRHLGIAAQPRRQAHDPQQRDTAAGVGGEGGEPSSSRPGRAQHLAAHDSPYHRDAPAAVRCWT